MPTGLKAHIGNDENVVILDTRSQGTFDEWHIDGETVDIVDLPYFGLLDGIPENFQRGCPPTSEFRFSARRVVRVNGR